MKKMITMVMIMVTILTTTVSAKDLVLTSRNTTDMKAKVVKIKKLSKDRRLVRIKCTSKNKYYGHLYEIILTKADWKNESFKKGYKVRVMFYTNNTLKITDDKIVNISHERYINYELQKNKFIIDEIVPCKDEFMLVGHNGLLQEKTMFLVGSKCEYKVGDILRKGVDF